MRKVAWFLQASQRTMKADLVAKIPARPAFLVTASTDIHRQSFRRFSDQVCAMIAGTTRPGSPHFSPHRPTEGRP
jgi:hypothetical protein